MAAVGKLVWAIHQRKENLWIAWVDHVYLKGANMHDHRPPVTGSCVWKTVCKVRDSLVGLLNGWDWMEGQKYKINDIYKQMLGATPELHWHRCVSNKLTQHKHRVKLWLAMQDRLPCNTRMIKFNDAVDQTLTAIHVGQEQKTGNTCLRIALLLFNAEMPCLWLQLRARQGNLLRLCIWASRTYKGGKLRTDVTIAAMAAAVYAIWKARNTSKWEGKVPCVNSVVSQIKKDVKGRFSLLKNRTIDGNGRD